MVDADGMDGVRPIPIANVLRIMPNGASGLVRRVAGKVTVPGSAELDIKAVFIGVSTGNRNRSRQ